MADRKTQLRTQTAIVITAVVVVTDWRPLVMVTVTTTGESKLARCPAQVNKFFGGGDLILNRTFLDE